MHSEVTITTQDNYPIVATVFKPEGEAKGAVVIAPAMSVPQSYYANFAQWLAQQGYLALTFDYRGIGRSAPKSLKRFKADIQTWAEQDCAAILDYLNESVSQKSDASKTLLWIGHSLGGQIIGMIPNCHLISKAITVASGNGYWKITANNKKLASLWLWYIAVPLALLFCSYFPGKKLRKVGDLPSGVIQQWRQWCLSKGYLMDNVNQEICQRYDDIQFPMTFYALADDDMLSYQSIKSAHNFYKNAPRQLVEVRPEDHNIKRIGHMGFFRQQFADVLWPKFIGSELTIANG